MKRKKDSKELMVFGFKPYLLAEYEKDFYAAIKNSEKRE
jgi:hypothetical protein